MDYEYLKRAVKDIQMSNDAKQRITDTVREQLREPESAPKPRRRGTLRRSAAVLLAAVLLLTISAFAFTAFAGDWFADYFADWSGQELTPDQYQFLAEQSVGLGQSVTKDGYTVTLESAICDASNLFLLLRIEGPEDVMLDFDPKEGNLSFDHTQFRTTGTQEPTGHILSVNGGWRHLDDGDGRDNTTTLILQHQRVLSADSNRVYTDGALWNLHFADLQTTTGDYYEIRTLLAEGGWSFTVPLTALDTSVELITTPVVCTAPAGGENKPKHPVSIRVTSFVLSPFGASCHYQLMTADRPAGLDIPEAYLVMQDGSTVPLRPRSGGASLGGGTMSYTVDAPLMLDKADYLVLPDNIQIPVPEA